MKRKTKKRKPSRAAPTPKPVVQREAVPLVRVHDDDWPQQPGEPPLAPSGQFFTMEGVVQLGDYLVVRDAAGDVYRIPNREARVVRT